MTDPKRQKPPPDPPPEPPPQPSPAELDELASMLERADPRDAERIAELLGQHKPPPRT